MTTQEITDIVNALKAESTDISTLTERTDISGLYTLGVNSSQASYKVPLEALYNEADRKRIDQLEAALRVFGFPFDYTLTTENMVWHYIKVNNKYLRYEAGVTASTGYPLESTSTKTSPFCWAFVGNPYSGFAIYNKAAGTKATLYLASYDSGQRPIMALRTEPQQWFVEKSLRSGYEGHVGIKTVGPSGNSWYVNDYSGAGRLAVYSHSQNTDNGSNVLVIPV